MTDYHQSTVDIFGKQVDLEKEWKSVAVELKSLCAGSQYIEYEKEIARLKIKLIHVQEEVESCRALNKNLSSTNDDLIVRVKNLISMQDNQLEQYSTALVLLTEERKDLWQSMKAFRSRIKELEDELERVSSQVEPEQVKVAVTRTVCISNLRDASTNTDTSETNDAMISANVISQSETVDEITTSSDDDSASNAGTKTVKHVERRLSSVESSLENISMTAKPAPFTAPTPKAKAGSFVNSMVQKLENKHKLKSFDESHLPLESEKEDFLAQCEVSPPPLVTPDTVTQEYIESSPCSESSDNVEELKFHVAELQEEIYDLRATCQSLTSILEKTYEEMQPSSSQSRDDVKDQLIACLRSRLLEAICDLTKVEKQGSRNIDTKSVACGRTLPRIPKSASEESSGSKSSGSSNGQGNPVTSSPTQSKLGKIVSSSNLKVLKYDNYSKLRKFSCWNPKTNEDSG